MYPERKLAEGMGYEHCVLFPAARVAVRAYVLVNSLGAVFLPSNICPALANAVGSAACFMPVGEKTGLSKPTGGFVVQLYGARQECDGFLDIDPLMTGWKRKPSCKSSIVSFGYSKTIDLGGGGAFLTNDRKLADEMTSRAEWPHELLERLNVALDGMDGEIERRLNRWRIWKNALNIETHPDWEPVVPWRFICLSERRQVILNSATRAGTRVGTNFPPLPGCTDPSSVKWGEQVLNFWLDDSPEEVAPWL